MKRFHGALMLALLIYAGSFFSLKVLAEPGDEAKTPSLPDMDLFKKDNASAAPDGKRAKEIRGWIRDLDSSQFRVRQDAEKNLKEAGMEALNLLREFAPRLGPEGRERAEVLVQDMELLEIAASYGISLDELRLLLAVNYGIQNTIKEICADYNTSQQFFAGGNNQAFLQKHLKEKDYSWLKGKKGKGAPEALCAIFKDNYDQMKEAARSNYMPQNVQGLYYAALFELLFQTGNTDALDEEAFRTQIESHREWLLGTVFFNYHAGGGNFYIDQNSKDPEKDWNGLVEQHFSNWRKNGNKAFALQYPWHILKKHKDAVEREEKIPECYESEGFVGYLLKQNWNNWQQRQKLPVIWEKDLEGMTDRIILFASNSKPKKVSKEDFEKELKEHREKAEEYKKNPDSGKDGKKKKRGED